MPAPVTTAASPTVMTPAAKTSTEPTSVAPSAATTATTATTTATTTAATTAATTTTANVPAASTSTTATAVKTTTDTAPADTAADKKSDVYADLPDDTQPTVAKDPFEGFNRFMFGFNEKVDKYAMKPVATFYNTIMPKPLNQGVHNFFNNLGTVPTLANDLLQLNFYQAANDSWRIIINTTVGVGGLFDVASRIGLEHYTNDFGLTLATYGYENSNYLVLPFFGPSTPRDGIIGLPVDYFLFSVYPYIEPQSRRYQVYGLGVVDRRAQLLKYQEVMEEASVDKYVFIRNAFMQRRAHQIEENQNLSYDRREGNQQPVADLTEEEAAAAIEVTAEPVQPSDQPLADSAKTVRTTAGNTVKPSADKAVKATAEKSAVKPAEKPAAKQAASAA